MVIERGGLFRREDGRIVWDLVPMVAQELTEVERVDGDLSGPSAHCGSISARRETSQDHPEFTRSSRRSGLTCCHWRPLGARRHARKSGHCLSTGMPSPENS
jgi:hypothetical protein